MDPITTSILAALTAGITGSASKVGQQAILDTYEALKNILRRKFGNQSDIIKSVEALETKPESAARKEMLKEEIATVKADQDPDILQAAQDLLGKIAAHPGGIQHIQQATGNYIAQADRGGTASVNVNAPQKD